MSKTYIRRIAAGACPKCGMRPASKRTIVHGRYAGQPTRRCEDCLTIAIHRQRDLRRTRALNDAKLTTRLFNQAGGPLMLRQLAARLRKEPPTRSLSLVAAAALTDAADLIKLLTSDRSDTRIPT